MKICAIGLRGIPDVMGGIESHCQQLYPKMVRQGAEVTVLARSPYVSQKRYNYEGVEVISVWALRHKLLETFLHTFIAILYARLFVRPDIVHLHAIGPALFTPFARLLGMKVMVTHHGADYDRQKWSPLAKKVLKLGEKMGVKYGNAVLVVGRTLTEQLKLRFPNESDKVQYVPNGMLPKFAEDVSDSFLPEDLYLQPYNYVLAVGRLVPEKGFHDLVQAYNKAGIAERLVIVGDADHVDEYASTLLANGNEKVIFAGRRSGNELHALFKYATLFVLPSYHEGLPIVALEAISAGTPVILSDIFPNKDIEAKNDSYFPVGNIDKLSTKLSRLASLDLKLDQQSFLARFDWRNIAATTDSTMRIIAKDKE
jgi:glycosyltransferase involved in cell wall biosynthesis